MANQIRESCYGYDDVDDDDDDDDDNHHRHHEALKLIHYL